MRYSFFVRGIRRPLIGEGSVPGAQQRAAVLEHRDGLSEVVRSPQQGEYLRHEDVLVEGLGDEVVRAEVHGHDDVHAVGGGGDEDDRNL